MPFYNWWGMPVVSEPEPDEPPDNTVTVTLYPTDSNLDRAKKIVQLLGFRGAVGDMVLAVHDVLEKYDQLDKQHREQKLTVIDGGKPSDAS